MKQLFLFSFDHDKLNTFEIYEESSFNKAYEKFDEMFKNKDCNTNITLMTREAFFNKFIQPISYLEWLDEINEWLNKLNYTLLSQGDFIDEYKTGVPACQMILKIIKDE